MGMLGTGSNEFFRESLNQGQVEMPEEYKPDYKPPETMTLQYPKLADKITEKVQAGENRNTIRKKLALAETKALAKFDPQIVNEYLGRTDETRGKFWDAMEAQKDNAYVEIYKYDMSEGKIRDIVKTAKESGIDPGFLLANRDNKELMQRAEEAAGTRRGAFMQFMAAWSDSAAQVLEGQAWKNTEQAAQKEFMNVPEIKVPEWVSENLKKSGLPDAEKYADKAVEIVNKLIQPTGDPKEAAKNDLWFADWQQNLADWFKMDKTRPPDSVIGAAILDAIRNGGFTIKSAVTSAAGWILGGPIGGMATSVYNTFDEAGTEAGGALQEIFQRKLGTELKAGNAFMQALREGVKGGIVTKADIEKALVKTGIVNRNNLLLLPASNYAGDFILHGTTELMSHLAGELLPGGGILKSLGRGAIRFIVPTIGEGIIEGNEEYQQEKFQIEALDDDPNSYLSQKRLKEATKAGAVDSVIYSIFGLGAGAGFRQLRRFTPSARLESKINQVLDESVKEIADVSRKIEKGEISLDDVAGEDPIVFIPKSKITPEIAKALDIQEEEYVNEDDEVIKNSEELGVRSEELENNISEKNSENSENVANEELNTNEENQEEQSGEENDDEVAVRKSTWDKFASENPEEAETLSGVIREGVQGVTVREQLARKFQEKIQAVAENSEVKKEKDRLKQEFIDAGRDENEAEILSTMAGIAAIRMSEQYPNVSIQQVMNITAKKVGGNENLGVRESHNQALNNEVDLDTEFEVEPIELTGEIASKEELTQKLRSLLSSGEIITKDKLGNISLGNNTKIKHVVHSSRRENSLNTESQELRGRALSSIQDLINNSVLVESVPNKKTDKKPDVTAYHRFYTPIATTDGNYYAVRIVAEEGKNGTLRPIQAVLYDVIIEGKKKISPLPQTSSQNEISPDLHNEKFRVTLRDLLQNVKDADGNLYITPENNQGEREIYNQTGFHGTQHIIEGNKLDLDKVNRTLYGWGVYLVDDKETAESYRNSDESDLGQIKKGNLYTFEGVPENDELLDFNAPMNEQPQKVQEAINSLIQYLEAETDFAEKMGFSPNDIIRQNIIGGRFYRTLSKYLKDGQKGASMLLNNFGIPGMRYLEIGSEHKENAHHNFVIWNTKLLKAIGISEDSENDAKEYFQKTMEEENKKTAVVVSKLSDREKAEIFINRFNDVKKSFNEFSEMTADDMAVRMKEKSSLVKTQQIDFSPFRNAELEKQTPGVLVFNMAKLSKSKLANRAFEVIANTPENALFRYGTQIKQIDNSNVAVYFDADKAWSEFLAEFNEQVKEPEYLKTGSVQAEITEEGRGKNKKIYIEFSGERANGITRVEKEPLGLVSLGKEIEGLKKYMLYEVIPELEMRVHDYFNGFPTIELYDKYKGQDIRNLSDEQKKEILDAAKKEIQRIMGAPLSQEGRELLEAQRYGSLPGKSEGLKSSTPKHESVTDYDSLIAKNKEAEPEFHVKMQELQNELGGELVERSEMKREARIKEKAETDYNGDFSRVVDVWGGSLIFDNEQDLLNALEKLKARGDVVRIKDKWNNPDDAGYREINANIRLFNGVVVELQLHHRGIMDVKKGIGHLLYEFTRNDKNKNNPEMFPLIYKALEISRELYQAGFDGRFAQIDASAKASLSEIALALSSQTSAREAGTLVNDLSALTRKTFSLSANQEPQYFSSLSSGNSTANGTSSPFSKNRNMDNTSEINNDNNQSLTENVKNVNEDEKRLNQYREWANVQPVELPKLKRNATQEEIKQAADEAITKLLDAFTITDSSGSKHILSEPFEKSLRTAQSPLLIEIAQKVNELIHEERHNEELYEANKKDIPTYKKSKLIQFITRELPYVHTGHSNGVTLRELKRGILLFQRNLGEISDGVYKSAISFIDKNGADKFNDNVLAEIIKEEEAANTQAEQEQEQQTEPKFDLTPEQIEELFEDENQDSEDLIYGENGEQVPQFENTVRGEELGVRGEPKLTAEEMRTAKSVSEAAEIISSLGILNTDIENKHLGITAQISGKGLSKMQSEKATKKSISPRLHALAVANVDKLFQSATIYFTHQDSHNRSEVEQVRRLGTVMFDNETGKYVPVMLTLIEYQRDGKKIYSVEAVDVVKYKNSAGQSTAPANSRIQVPITEFVERIAELADTVNNKQKLSPEVGHPSISPESELSAAGHLSALDDKNILDYEEQQINASTSWEKGKPSNIAESLIEFFSTANKSSGFHEFAHHIMRVIGDVVEATEYGDNPDYLLINDFNMILENAGVSREEYENNEEKRNQAQEYFATSFETYLSEGHAPNKELVSAFERIKQWFVEVYRDIKEALGVELNDEMRDFFDRLLATPEQAAEQKSINDINSLYEATQEELEFTQDEIERLEAEQAEIEAQQELLEEMAGYEEPTIPQEVSDKVEKYLNDKEYEGLDDELFQAKLRSAKSKSAKLQAFKEKDRREAENLYAPYIAINTDTLNAFLQQAGIDATRNYLKERAEYIQKLIKNLQKRLPGSYAQVLREQKKAEKTGQKGETLKQAQSEYNAIKSDIEALINEQKEISDSAEFLNRIDPNEIKESISFDNAMMTLAEAINNGLKLAERYAGIVYNEAQETQKAESERRAQAEIQSIESMNEYQINKLNSEHEAEIKKLKEQQAAEIVKLGEGSKEKISELKAKYEGKIAELKAAHAEKIKSLRENSRTKTAEKIASLKERYKQMKERQRERLKIRQEYNKLTGQIKRMAKSKNVIWNKQQKIKEVLGTYDNLIQKNYSLDDVREIHRQVEELYETGKRELEAKKLLIRERNAETRAKLTATLQEDYNKRPKKIIKGREDLGKDYSGIKGKARKILDWSAANMLGAQRFFDWLDGNKKYQGVWNKFMSDKVNEAHTQELRHKFRRLGEFEAKRKELGINLSSLRNTRVIDINGGEDFTISELMGIYAGLKNEKAKQAILNGNFVNAKDLNEANEWAAKCVEALTDKEKELADFIIQEYENNFDRINDAIIDVYNQGMEHEENYTPMRRLVFETHRDGVFDPDAAENAAKQGAGFRSVEKGFTENRKKINPKHQQGIDLDLISIWHSQVAVQEHAAAFAGLIRDMRSVLFARNKDGGATVYQMIKATRGQAAATKIRQYFNIAATSDALNAYDALEGISKVMARNMSIAYLCGNLGTMAKQTGSFPRVLVYAGPTATFNALGQFFRHPKKFIEECYKLDPQLEERQRDSFIDELIKGGRGKIDVAYGNVLKAMSAPIGFSDRITSAIVFKAVYDANIKKGLSHDDAVREGQRVVLLTQPNTQAKDKPLVWQQHGYARLAMMFTTDMAQTFGETFYDLTASIRRGDVKDSVYRLVGLTLAACLIKCLTSGTPDEPDDPEELAKWIASAFTEQTINSIPVIGKNLVSLWDFKNGYFNSTDAFVAPFAKLAMGSRSLLDNKIKNDEQAYWNLIEGGALLAPFPATGLKRLWKAGKALGQDGAASALARLFGISQERKKKVRRFLR